MQIHHDISNLPSFRSAVITFGSFDGLHLGHKEIFEEMKVLAGQCEGESIVVTFEPHPRQVIYPNDRSLRLLSSKEEKMHLLKNSGVDHLVFCPFSVEFSQLLPDEYITNFIMKRFHPRYIVIGYDHRFGLNRGGNVDFLKSHEEEYDFEVIEIEQQIIEKIQISSTRIRNYLQKGNISMANKLLGHAYPLVGKVVEGHRIGERLGYPTANIALSNSLKLIPPEGVYAVRVELEGKRYDGMLYIGTRPTVTSDGKRSIEVHIFDFSDDIYGKQICVEIIDFIRKDMTFQNLEELRHQLDLDKRDVQTSLSETSINTVKAAIVILNYNGLNHLQKFLPTVFRCTNQAKYQVIIADNGSTDESVKWIAETYPQCRVIQIEQNKGFAGGYNEALKLTNAEYYLLLNSDVEVTNHWLEPLVDFLESNPLVGACQPKIKSLDHRDNFEYAGAAGGLMDALGYPFCQGRILSEVEEDCGQYDEIKEVFWVTGAAMCLRAELFHKLKGFDSDFFAHMEEIDLCWRMKQAGYQVAYVPNSVVYHKGGGTLSYLSPRKTYLNFRNGLSLLLKNEKGLKLLWLFPLRLVLDWIALVRFLVVREGGNALAVIKAHGYMIKNFFRSWSKRKEVLRISNKHRVDKDNTATGRYQGSIIWEFFVLGKKRYADLSRIQSKSAM